ncbi:hypothetical protein [Streptomyces sp. SID13031]|uniref:hypothetical protein n=1 Tax=Streptomyces sp. SID13031 TaxID=2706046 RepID=UPI0013CAF5CB|nr:hypothetical protein [Streptomyces sp. SID13031]NEA37213.1 hypothetical protein [Streptomyces sp. SID13031]
MGITVRTVTNGHRLTTEIGGGRHLVVMSGTAHANFKGTGGSFESDDFYVNIGPVWRQVDDVAPMAALAAWFNKGNAVNAGAAVDSCGWKAEAVAELDERIRLYVKLAVSDIDGWLYRFSYTATAIGILSPNQFSGPTDFS